MTNGIICCACSISAISVLQLALKQWRKDFNKVQEKNESQQISTNDEPYCKGAVERIILDFSKPGEQKLWKSKSLGVQLLRKRKDRGDPISASTERKPSTTIIMSNLWKVSPQQATQSGMMTMLGLLKSGKLILRCTSDRGDPMSLLGERHENPNLVFSHEETHHDGTTQSVVNEVIPREGSGRPDVDSQRGAWPQQFVIGNDEAQLELSIESRSFVNRVNDQVRKRQKRISNVTEDGEKRSMIW